jgi:hypothetical protein
MSHGSKGHASILDDELARFGLGEVTLGVLTVDVKKESRDDLGGGDFLVGNFVWDFTMPELSIEDRDDLDCGCTVFRI